MSNSSPIQIIIGSANPELGQQLCEHLNVKACEREIIEFSEGNTFVKINDNVRGCDVYVLQGVCYPVDRNFMELLFWIDAAKLASARSVTAVIPFFSYAKADKKDEPRVSIRARVCADALEAAGVDRVLTMDLHSPQIQGFFKRPVDHMHAKYKICDYVKAKKLTDLVVASADVGYGKNAFKYSSILGVPTVIGNKVRTDHSENAQVWSVVGEVKNKNVLIVDDIVFTGGSLISMSAELKKMGAKSVMAAVTHGVLTPGATAKIDDSEITELIITNTVEYRFQKLSRKVTILSVADSFARAIESIHDHRSLSKLFPD